MNPTNNDRDEVRHARMLKKGAKSGLSFTSRPLPHSPSWPTEAGLNR